MANKAHLDILRLGAQKWNDWRMRYLRAGETPDLSGANLRGVDLREAHLYRANLRRTDLSQADLRGADLGEADLGEANLSGADLRKTVLRGAFCLQTDFSGANLLGADLSAAIIAGANLQAAKMPAGFGPGLQAIPSAEDKGAANLLEGPDRQPRRVIQGEWRRRIDGQDIAGSNQPRLPAATETPRLPEPDLTKQLDKQGEEHRPESEFRPEVESPVAAELDVKERTEEPAHVGAVGKRPKPGMRKRRKLIIELPHLGKEYAEGEKKERLSKYYEREPRLRVAAIAIHGTKCAVCGFDFEAFYGAHGAGYIEVHHLRPISSLQSSTIVDPQTDMIVLCANCHRMVHRNRDRILSPDELRSLIQSNHNQNH